MSQNKETLLILTYDKFNHEKDVTSRVSFYKNYGNRFLVYFYDSSQAFYYSYENIIIDDFAVLAQCSGMEYKGALVKGVTKVYYFPNSKHYKIYQGSHYFVGSSSDCRLILKQDADYVEGYFKYYSELCTHIDELEFNGGDLFSMARQCNNVGEVENDSVLFHFFAKNNEKHVDTKTVIFPFGFNNSQYHAVINGLTYDVSVIQGPPGTGKTQTILNLIANGIYRNQTLAVCSNNNEALANIQEKLDGYGYSDCYAFLGNQTNVSAFFSKKSPTFKTEFQPTTYLQEEYQEALNKKLQYFKAMVEIKKVEEKIHAIEDEKKRFIKENNFDEKDSSNQNLLRGRKRNENSNAIMKAIVYLQDQHRDKLSLICRFHCYFTEKLTTKALKKSLTNLIAALNNQYYSALLSDLEKVRLGFQKDIDSYDPEKLDNILQSYSRSQLDQALVERRKGVSDGSDFAQDSYQLLFDEFVQCYPVILSSTYSLLKTTGDGFKYDVLIIDEASQVSMASAIIAMSIAKRIVVVGDLKQLPEIDNEELRPIDNTLIEKYRVPPCFQYSDNNILKAVASCYKEELPFTILTEHYRCQRDIISFSNRRFYNNELICLTKPDGISNHIEIIKTVPGNHARKNPKGTGLYNLREIDEIVSYITTDKTKNIGVITPYRCQAELLQEKLDDRAEVDTIHKFQGRECDEIIFSTVSNSSDDYYHNQELRENFVNNKELLNVAMTRAKHKFVLITSDKIFNDSKGPLGDLVKYIRYETESDVEEGSVKSVFDILYEDYAEVRNQYLLKKHPNEVITEVIFSDVLKRILKNAKYQSLTFVQHLPLKEAIKIKEEYFTPEELKYLRHPWTHLDFAILNRFNNKPVLFIEIDGVSYHEQQKKQHLHDDIKDKALEFSGVKHLRLRTNESQEEAKIEAALCSLL